MCFSSVVSDLCPFHSSVTKEKKGKKEEEGKANEGERSVSFRLKA